MATDWQIYKGKVAANVAASLQDAQETTYPSGDPLHGLPPPPPWRRFAGGQHDRQRGLTFRPPPSAVEMVNVALYLRRPLLITGKPGSGKSSLAYAVAEELQLGTVLKWPINTRATLQEGLYRYDAIARLRDAQLSISIEETTEAEALQETVQQIGRYIRLGPLGTALLPTEALTDPPPALKPGRPRVLLIDEIDKSDIDLPNDLLNVFEDGEFPIPELARRAAARVNEEGAQDDAATVEVTTDDDLTARIQAGRVRCTVFPFIILTSNGERDFPPAFLRRCVRLKMEQPREIDELKPIISAHLGETTLTEASDVVESLMKSFLTAQQAAQGDLATDQLLNLVFMLTRNVPLDDAAKKLLQQTLLQRLSPE